MYGEEDRITFVKTTPGENPTEDIHPATSRKARPFLIPPLLCSCLCLAAILTVTLYSAIHPTYEQETLTIPATFLPPQTFKASQPIVPTGSKYYPATTAHGALTLTNGSVITMQLPAGMIFSSGRIEVETDTAVTVPAGSAEGYGLARVSAHAVMSGSQGNIPALTINQVYGTSLFIRNLTAFKGGQDAYTLHYVTSQDKQNALDVTKASVTMQEARTQAILAKPCKESVLWSKTVQLTSHCQFVAYPKVPGKVLSVHLAGNRLFIDVVLVARPNVLKKG